MLTRMTMFLACALWLALPAQAGSKNLKVVDGDSLELNGKKIRLLGIDAPEYSQSCYDSYLQKYDCGNRSKDFLQKLVDKAHQQNQKIRCKHKQKDIYKRLLSICYAGQTNLNLEMVKNGWAVSYRDTLYQKEEQEAKSKGLGIWQGKFMRPEIYRAIKRNLQNKA